MKKTILSIILLIFGSLTSVSQNPYIRHYTTLDGLPSNTIYQIYQDSKHFMWLTTDAGVVKFDGSSFINYRKSSGLSSNDVIRMREDKLGRIWFFCYNASLNYYYSNRIYSHNNSPYLNAMSGKGLILDCFNYKDKLLFYNMQCEVFQLDSNCFVTRNKFFKKARKLPLLWNTRQSVRVSFLDLCNDTIMRIWTSYGIYSQDKFTSFPIEVDTTIKVEAVYPCGEDYYYVKTTNLGLLKLDKDLNYKKISLSFDYTKIKYVQEDSKGYLWICAYDKGVYCYKNDLLIKWIDIKESQYVFEDYENNIWISSQTGGLYLVSRDILTQKHIPIENFSGLRLKSIVNGVKTGLWTTDGRSLFHVNKGKVTKIEIFEDDGIDLVYPLDEVTIFLGKRNKYFHIVKDNRFPMPKLGMHLNLGYRYDVSIKKMFYDNNRDIKVLFDQNRVIEGLAGNEFGNLKVTYISERINNSFFDSRNNLIINGRKNYVYEKGRIFPSLKFKKFDGCVIVDHERIDHLTEVINVDGERLFLISNSQYYDILGDVSKSINSQIRKIIVHNKCLYFNTSSNIYFCDNVCLLAKGKEVFVQPIGINFQSISDFLLLDDSLFIVSDIGLTIISEKQFKDKNSFPPTPYIASVSINDVISKYVPQEVKVVGKNTISIKCKCIDFAKFPYYYLYILEEKDTMWRKARGGDFDIVYQDLPKGKYKFKLKVRKGNSDWSRTLEFPIIIRRMFYEYPIFWVFVAVILGLITFFTIVQIRNQRLRRVENSHQLIVMEQRSLLSMMNPHFIFNSLGSIQGFLLKNRTGEAIMYLTQFARLIRQNFSAINMTMIYLDEEAERLKNYLELEQIRLENKFDYFIDLQPGLSEEMYYIPSMIIQPFVENAVWHGIAGITEIRRGVVRVQFQFILSDLLKVTVEDNGLGVIQSAKLQKKSAHLKRSMGMTTRRLRLLGIKYDCKAHLVITELYPHTEYPGTRVEIFMPITSQKPEEELFPDYY